MPPTVLYTLRGTNHDVGIEINTFDKNEKALDIMAIVMPHISQPSLYAADYDVSIVLEVKDDGLHVIVNDGLNIVNICDGKFC
jgi:hypothetical protein